MSVRLRRRASPRALPAAVAILLATGGGVACAQGQAALPVDPAAIRAFVERHMPAGAGRLEVRPGALDARLQLAPCARIEPGLLPGTRLWGRTAIALRCTEGATWTVSLPLDVVVRGRALVAGEALPVGASPASASLRIEETELSREAGTPVTDPAQLVGKALNRPLQAGQVLRLEHLRVMQTVAAGEPVRIQLIGQGFSIQADGQTLAGAGDGQTVRVRTESGRILSGILRGRTVDVRI